MHRIHSVLMKKSTGVPVVLLPAIWFLPVSMMDAGWKSVVAHRLMTASTRRPAENIDQSSDDDLALFYEKDSVGEVRQIPSPALDQHPIIVLMGAMDLHIIRCGDVI